MPAIHHVLFLDAWVIYDSCLASAGRLCPHFLWATLWTTSFMSCKSRVSIGLRGDAYKLSSRRCRQASLIFRVVMFTEVGWSAVNKTIVCWGRNQGRQRSGSGRSCLMFERLERAMS